MTFTSIISVPRQYDKEGALSCGIYLVAPQQMPIQMFDLQMQAAFRAINSSLYEKNMHALEIPSPEEIFEKERQEATAIVAVCKRNSIVPIVRESVPLCIECGAEGVIVSTPEAVAQARHVLGEDAIIGMDCGTSQELAEQALAAGVDYVSFGSEDAPLDVALLGWWSSKSHLPAVAKGTLDVERCIEMAKAGAGFIGAGQWVWAHEEGPARAIYWLQEAIEHGLSTQQIN